MRRRPLAWIVSLAAVVLVGAGGLGAWFVTRGERTDCGEFVFDRAAWEQASGGAGLEETESPSEKERRRLARGLVECHLLDRATKQRVRSLLGAPDDSGVDPDPVPHREWSYKVGTERGDYSSGEEQSLFMEFGKDERVQVVEAPPPSSTDSSDGAVSSGQGVGEPRVALPRVVGLPRSEATQLLLRSNLRWRYEGPNRTSRALVRGQWPSPGKQVLQDFRIVLEMEGRCDRDPDIPSGFWPRRGRRRNGGRPRDY